MDEGSLIVLLLVFVLAALGWMGWGMILIGNMVSEHCKETRKHIRRNSTEGCDG